MWVGRNKLAGRESKPISSVIPHLDGAGARALKTKHCGDVRTCNSDSGIIEGTRIKERTQTQMLCSSCFFFFCKKWTTWNQCFLVFLDGSVSMCHVCVSFVGVFSWLGHIFAWGVGLFWIPNLCLCRHDGAVWDKSVWINIFGNCPNSRCEEVIENMQQFVVYQGCLLKNVGFWQDGDANKSAVLKIANTSNFRFGSIVHCLGSAGSCWCLGCSILAVVSLWKQLAWHVSLCGAWYFNLAGATGCYPCIGWDKGMEGPLSRNVCRSIYFMEKRILCDSYSF